MYIRCSNASVPAGSGVTSLYNEIMKMMVNACLISEVLIVLIPMIPRTHDSDVKRSSFCPKHDLGSLYNI